MRPILAVICENGQRQSSRVPGGAVVELLKTEPVDHSFVTVKLGPCIMEMLREDLLEKAVPLIGSTVSPLPASLSA